MLQVTPAEWAAIEAAGSGVLFREGDYLNCQIHERHPNLNCRPGPPAEFVEAAQPCHKQPPSLALEACGEAPCGGCDPHCLDGKRRVAVAVPCRVCQDLMATVPHVVAKGEHPDGLVTVGHVVMTWGPLEVVELHHVGNKPCAFVSGGTLIVAVTYDEHGWYYRRVTLPPDIDPQSLVGQYTIGLKVVP